MGTLVAFSPVLGIVGYASLENFHRYMRGDGEALGGGRVSIASNVGDIICFDVLTAPLVFIAPGAARRHAGLAVGPIGVERALLVAL